MPIDMEDSMKRGPVVLLVTAIIIFSAVWFIETSRISSGRAYAPERSVSELLGAEKIREEGGRTWFGRAWKERRDGNLVVSISGGPYEMGFSTGRFSGRKSPAAWCRYSPIRSRIRGTIAPDRRFYEN